jgi:hypothetical protein
LAITLIDWQIDEKDKKFLGGSGDHNSRIVIMDADGKNQRELKLDTKAKISWMSLNQWQ